MFSNYWMIEYTSSLLEIYVEDLYVPKSMSDVWNMSVVVSRYEKKNKHITQAIMTAVGGCIPSWLYRDSNGAIQDVFFPFGPAPGKKYILRRASHLSSAWPLAPRGVLCRALREGRGQRPTSHPGIRWRPKKTCVFVMTNLMSTADFRGKELCEAHNNIWNRFLGANMCWW